MAKVKIMTKITKPNEVKREWIV
ncbi:50S ribosomal protein L13, partial [Campylobacter coli]|nr:50S ribosomal protein L13 [Campylobacter coli]